MRRVDDPEREAYYEKKWKEQKGRCAICKRTPKDVPINMQSHWRFPLDHSHFCDCGKKKGCPKCWRGILCQWCNRRLGALENHEFLRDAYNYMEYYWVEREYPDFMWESIKYFPESW